MLNCKYRSQQLVSRITCAIASCVLIAACGGGDDFGVTTPDPSDTEPANSAPIISGTPAGSVQVSSNYEFLPSASDADGDVLQFSAVNVPPWAEFNLDTGMLFGRPTESDAASYADITVSVSDGIATASLPAFSIEVTVSPPQNRAPTINGSPATVVQAGQPYLFAPGVNDPDGDTLFFSITGKPAWADFDGTNGSLSGTPDIENVGSHNNISITVSDGTASATLPAFSIAVQAEPATGTATISWIAPSKYRDGSPLTNIAGYRIYYGTVAGNLNDSQTVNDSGATFATVTGLASGTWYFTVRAFDQLNAESANSDVVSKQIP